MYSDQLIIDLNFRNNLIDERKTGSEFDNHKMFDLLTETIVDKRTLQMIEVHDLYKALDHTTTYVGSARLFHSLMQPSESLEQIHAKQEAVMELEASDRLRNAIEEYLGVYQVGEKALFKVLNAHMLPMFPYRDISQAMRTGREMVRAVKSLPRPETVYLDSLFKIIGNFEDTGTYDLLNRPVYRTLSGVLAKSEKMPFSPAMRFRPGRVSGGSIWPALPSIFAAIAGFTGYLSPPVAKSIVILTCGGIFVGILYGGVIKPMVDFETAILPIRQRLIESDRFASAIEAVAGIDELLSFIRYREAMPHPTVFPEMHDSPNHFFEAKNLRNPIRALRDPGYVPNDVNLDGPRVSFITGPNSGGKTTYCKTIVQSQIMAQIGAPVVASAARMSIADHIAYQAPQFDSLNDEEGRFGTELATTKNIFFAVTPKSLAILDEIAEGTTWQEKMTLSVDVMEGFYAKGNNTLLVTHSSELVEKFRELGRGQYLMVEFMDQDPTHRMVEGVSKESHAHRVAKKIGFSREDIQRHLIEKGYVPSPATED